MTLVDTGSRELLDLLGSFVVRISGPGVRGGSGFFAGHGLVITCAHVVAQRVKGGRRATAGRVEASWLGGQAEGSVVALPPTHSGDGLWNPPDLAVITLDDPVPDHPWMRLSEESPCLEQRLYAVGYSTIYEQTPQLGVSAVEYEGPQRFGDGHTVLQLKNGELAPGKSGGPLLDLERGEVCGIVTTTRRENLDMGGLALAVPTVCAAFPDLWEANKAPSHLDTELWQLRAALLHEFAPGAVLSLREEKLLIRAARASGLSPAGLYWRSVHRDYGEPSGRLDTVADALREVADAPAMQDGPHPLLQFIRQVTEAAPPHDADGLTGLIDLVAQRFGVPVPPRTAALSAPSKDRVAAISVHLESHAPGSERYRLRVWKYPNASNSKESAYPVLCDDRPLTLAEAQEQLRVVVPSAIRDLAETSGRLFIEFALPTAKLSTVDVDTWYLSQAWAPLSRQYPVVLRAVDRELESYGSWTTRWQRLLTGPHTDTMIEWVDCHSDMRSDQFFAWLQKQRELCVLALSFSPEATARQHVLEMALHAGIPAAVWTRGGCSTLCRLKTAPKQGRGHTAASEDSSEACAGLAFRNAFLAELARCSIRELPELIMKLRVEAVAEPGHCGEKVVLLWDDAIRKLPGDGPALRTP